MKQEAQEICEELDAALFSSDLFREFNAVTEFRDYLKRWEKEIDEIAKMFDS